MPRPKQFDIDQALQRAMETFWERGYEATSMSELLDRMGINRASFYDTFTSKHQVLVDALTAYGQQQLDAFKACTADMSMREVIEKLFSELAKSQKCEDGRRGCMVVNAAMERAGMDPEVDAIVKHAMVRHERFYRDRIEADQERGLIRPDLDATQTASALLAMTLGAQVLARASFPKRGIVAVGECALALLE